MPIMSRSHMALFCIAIGTGANAMPAPATTVAPLKPSGAWQVDYGENECRLIREFGTGEDKIWLRIARGPSLDKYDIMIGGTSLVLSKREVTMTINALPDGASVSTKATPYIAQIDGKANNIYRSFDVYQAFFDGLTNTQVLSFKSGKTLDLTLQTNGIKKALVSLATCHDNLLTTVFKLDLPLLRSYQSLPEPNKDLAWWVTTDDYPREALTNNWTGQVQFIVTVDDKGKPADCNVVISSGYPVLDQTACQFIMKRGSFTPAKDANGKAVTAPWIKGVNWQIPR